MKKPESVNILGKTYRVEYVDNPASVDIFKRSSLWGQVDFWTRTIRVYHNGNPAEDVWHILMHEILHAVAQELHLKSFGNEANHDELDIVALAMVDVLTRNGWLVVE